MRITLIGYGKMGKAIEKIALERGHIISHIIDADNAATLKTITAKDTDAVIEFTRPESAFENVKTCIENGIPTVVGTTGWLDRKPEIEKLTVEKNGAFFYASNFSIGVNIFFHLNKVLSKLMSPYPQYDVEMEEIHHIHKLDAPSGTAITLAEGVLENFKHKTNWELDKASTDTAMKIVAKREGEVPGTHSINYFSEIDSIEIKHTAHTRYGFALGSVVAAEWIADKKGVLGMDDMLKL